MIIGTKTEFENLADYILRDYLGSEYDSYSPLNVDAFAKDYLKLDISYLRSACSTDLTDLRCLNTNRCQNMILSWMRSCFGGEQSAEKNCT